MSVTSKAATWPTFCRSRPLLSQNSEKIRSAKCASDFGNVLTEVFSFSTTQTNVADIFSSTSKIKRTKCPFDSARQITSSAFCTSRYLPARGGHFIRHVKSKRKNFVLIPAKGGPIYDRSESTNHRSERENPAV